MSEVIYMGSKTKKTNEHRKRKQAIACGLLPHTGHRSHSSGVRWLRPWLARMHQQEMAKAKRHFEEEEM
jgi:hypothetical protein